jgi:predicted nucleic acid-binding Zn ribbon protein
MMRGRRKSVATALAEVLGRHRETGEAAIAAAFVEACGPRLSRSASFRGVMRDGRLLVLATDEAWAGQVRAHADELCARINARLGRVAARGLDVRVGAPGSPP